MATLQAVQAGRQHSLLARESCSPTEDEEVPLHPTEEVDAEVPEEVTHPDGNVEALPKIGDKNDKKRFSADVSSPASLSSRSKSGLECLEAGTESIDLHGLESEIKTEESQREKALTTRVADIFLGSQFEFAIAILLCINLLLMAIQLQYHGYRIGHEINYGRGYGVDIEYEWPYAEDFFIAGDITFAVLFTMEMRLGKPSLVSEYDMIP